MMEMGLRRTDIHVQIEGCIYDSFSPGEFFTTQQATGICIQHCYGLFGMRDNTVKYYVQEVLNRLAFHARTLELQPNGWRLL